MKFSFKDLSFILPVIMILATYFRFQESCRHRTGFKAQISFPHYIASVQHAERREVTFSCSLKENCSHFMKSSFLKVHTLRIICHLRYRMILKKKKKRLIAVGIAEWPFCREVICNISQCKKLHKIFQHYFLYGFNRKK